MAKAWVVPTTVAQDAATLAAALDARPNITSVAVEYGVGTEGEAFNAVRIEVVGTASVDITNAITAVGNCALQPGTSIQA